MTAKRQKKSSKPSRPPSVSGKARKGGKGPPRRRAAPPPPPPPPPPPEPPKRPVGRPTKLTPELIADVCLAIQNGVFVETAAAYVGLSKDTLYRWLKKGARAKGGLFREFSDAIGVAFAQAEVNMVAALATAAQKGDSRAITFWLERARQSTWGKRERLEVGGIPKAEGGAPIAVGVTVYLPKEDPE